MNVDNEDNVMVIGEEKWEDLFRNRMEITGFNGFSCESPSKDDIDIAYNDKERQTWTLNTPVREGVFLRRPVDQ